MLKANVWINTIKPMKPGLDCKRTNPALLELIYRPTQTLNGNFVFISLNWQPQSVHVLSLQWIDLGFRKNIFQMLSIWEVWNVWPIYGDPQAACKMISLQLVSDVGVDLQTHELLWCVHTKSVAILFAAVDPMQISRTDAGGCDRGTFTSGAAN